MLNLASITPPKDPKVCTYWVCSTHNNQILLCLMTNICEYCHVLNYVTMRQIWAELKLCWKKPNNNWIRENCFQHIILVTKLNRIVHCYSIIWMDWSDESLILTAKQYSLPISILRTAIPNDSLFISYDNNPLLFSSSLISNVILTISIG